MNPNISIITNRTRGPDNISRRAESACHGYQGYQGRISIHLSFYAAIYLASCLYLSIYLSIIYLSTHTRACTHARTHTHPHYARAPHYAYTRTLTHAHHAYAHTYTLTRMLTYIHTRKYARTSSLARTHTQAKKPPVLHTPEELVIVATTTHITQLA